MILGKCSKMLSESKKLIFLQIKNQNEFLTNNKMFSECALISKVKVMVTTQVETLFLKRHVNDHVLAIVC